MARDEARPPFEPLSCPRGFLRTSARLGKRQTPNVRGQQPRRHPSEGGITGADVNQRVILYSKNPYIKNRVIVIPPNNEVEVGTMNPGAHLVVREIGGPTGREWKAFIEAAALFLTSSFVLTR